MSAGILFWEGALPAPLPLRLSSPAGSTRAPSSPVQPFSPAQHTRPRHQRWGPCAPFSILVVTRLSDSRFPGAVVPSPALVNVALCDLPWVWSWICTRHRHLRPGFPTPARGIALLPRVQSLAWLQLASRGAGPPTLPMASPRDGMGGVRPRCLHAQPLQSPVTPTAEVCFQPGCPSPSPRKTHRNLPCLTSHRQCLPPHTLIPQAFVERLLCARPHRPSLVWPGRRKRQSVGARTTSTPGAHWRLGHKGHMHQKQGGFRGERRSEEARRLGPTAPGAEGTASRRDGRAEA